MRLARIAHPSGVALVVIEGDEVAEIADHPFGQPQFTGKRWPLADVRLLAPIMPPKITGVGQNYAPDAAEMCGEPRSTPPPFLKPAAAVIGPNAPTKRPPSSARVDYEGELAVVIGQPVRNVPASRAKDVSR